MSKNILSKNSYTDHKKLKAMNDQDVNLSDIPEMSGEKISASTWRFDGIPLSKGKVRINILLDETVVAYFKTLANGRGYQTLINEALKNSLLHDDLATTIRRIIREELKAAS